jgi:hypothetical protein
MLTTLFLVAAAQNASTTAAADTWTNCLIRQIERTHSGTGSVDQVVDGAMRSCAAQELTVRRAVEREFGTHTAAEVSSELDKLNRETRAEMRKGVIRLRGQGGSAARPPASVPAMRPAVPPAARPVARPVTTAGGRLRRPLEFHNKCRLPVRYFLYHIGPDRKWRTHGWYTAPAFQKPQAVNDANRQPLYHSEGETLYSYAESTGPTYLNWRGAQEVTFAGARYMLQKSTLTVVNGKYQFGLNCDGR